MNDHIDPLAWARFMEMDSPAPNEIPPALIQEYKGKAHEIVVKANQAKAQGRPHEEVEDLIFQGENIRTMISDIFTKRLGKIMAIARDWPHVNTKDLALLPWEMEFFERVVTLVEEYRAEGWIE